MATDAGALETGAPRHLGVNQPALERENPRSYRPFVLAASAQTLRTLRRPVNGWCAPRRHGRGQRASTRKRSTTSAKPGSGTRWPCCPQRLAAGCRSRSFTPKPRGDPQNRPGGPQDAPQIAYTGIAALECTVVGEVPVRVDTSSDSDEQPEPPKARAVQVGRRCSSPRTST